MSIYFQYYVTFLLLSFHKGHDSTTYAVSFTENDEKWLWSNKKSMNRNMPRFFYFLLHFYGEMINIAVAQNHPIKEYKCILKYEH